MLACNQISYIWYAKSTLKVTFPDISWWHSIATDRFSYGSQPTEESTTTSQKVSRWNDVEQTHQLAMRMRTIRRCYKWIALTASPSSIARPLLRRNRFFLVSLRPRVNEEFMSLLWEEKKVDCPRAGWSDVEGSWFAQDDWCCLFSTLWNAKVGRLFYQGYHVCLPNTMTQRGAKREHVWKQGFHNNPKELAFIRCSTKPEDHSQSRSRDTSWMQGSRRTYSRSWTQPEGSAPKQPVAFCN